MHRATVRRQWNALLTTVWLFGLLLLVSLVEGFGYRLSHTPWVVVAAETLSAVVVAGFAVRATADLAPLLGRPGKAADLRDALEVVGVTIAVAAALIAYFRILAALGVPFTDAQPAYLKTAANIWIVAATLCVAPPIVEETAFRGILQSRLATFISRREALVVQAALFAVLHLSPMVFVSHFVMGLYLGYLRDRTGSLYPGMLAHAAWNTLVLLQAP